jgi:hypothetical protein
LDFLSGREIGGSHMQWLKHSIAYEKHNSPEIYQFCGERGGVKAATCINSFTVPYYAFYSTDTFPTFLHQRISPGKLNHHKLHCIDHQDMSKFCVIWLPDRNFEN